MRFFNNIKLIAMFLVYVFVFSLIAAVIVDNFFPQLSDFSFVIGIPLGVLSAYLAERFHGAD